MLVLNNKLKATLRERERQTPPMPTPDLVLDDVDGSGLMAFLSVYEHYLNSKHRKQPSALLSIKM